MLAHPRELELPDEQLACLAERWQRQGLRGLEVWHPSAAAGGFAPLERLARNGLLAAAKDPAGPVTVNSLPGQKAYVSAGGADGTVKEIRLFYTIITTVDNVRITVPNGSLMNANVSNYSAEPSRRVDRVFSCAKGEDIEKIQQLMLDVMKADSRILTDPAPFARLSGGSNEAMQFTTRAWTTGNQYWDVYFDLTQKITAALGEAGVKAPAVRILNQ